MRYAIARYKESRRDLAYRIFVTESLKLIPQQQYLNIKYTDMISDTPPDTRTGDEIAKDVIEKMGLNIK